MKLNYLGKIGLFLLVLATFPLLAESPFDAYVPSDVVQPAQNGSVDWGAMVIKASGSGAPPQNMPAGQARLMAQRAAETVARRNLLEIVEGVQVTSETVVRNFVTESDEIRTRVAGIIKGAFVGKPRYMSDGTVEIDVFMKISGDLAEAILPPKMGDKNPQAAASAAPGAVPPAPPVAPEAPPAAIYTGLVIDSTGMGVKPAMSPRILDENGMEVYGSAYVSRDFAVQQGMVGYAKDLEKAKKQDRVMNPPPPNVLVIKAIRVEGNMKTDIVISNADAAAVKASTQHLKFLSECRVMFVI